MRSKLILLAVVMGVAAVLGFPRASQAVSIVPPSIEFSGAKGATFKTTVKIFNESSSDQLYFPTTANFVAGDENGTPSFDPKAGQTDLAGWISVDAKQYSVAAGQRIEIPVTVNVPNDADPGGHYAGLFFGTQPPSKNGISVGIASKVGILVILKVEGNVLESASVKEFSVLGSKTTLPFPPVSFDLRIQNAGNVHVRPSGSVVIHNMIGGTTANLTINPTEGAVLPNSIRKFQIDWLKPTNNPKGFFSNVGAEWNNFGMGGYTATATIAYGSSSQPLTATTKFNLFPWHLLLVELIMLVIVIMVLIWGVKGYNNMIIRQAKKMSGPTTRQ